MASDVTYSDPLRRRPNNPNANPVPGGQQRKNPGRRPGGRAPTIGILGKGSRRFADVATDLARDRIADPAFQQPFQAELTDRPLTGDLGADRARIEEEVFGRLSRGMDQDQARAVEGVQQSLMNRGIPYSDDPNSRYQQEMRDVNERFDMARTDARQRAAEIGGSELERTFGIGEQTRANQMQEQLTPRQINLAETEAISQFGQPGVGLYAGIREQRKARKQANRLARMQMARSGGGGAPAPTAEDQAFSNSVYPGYAGG